jgi:NitT/TauT family transport system ATP-binding protein
MDELKLEIKNISKGFGEIYNREDILEDFDLKVMSAELLVLVGPSGCGKSTFVNLIAGFDKVDTGSIIMDGKEINKPGNDRMVVFQETALIPWQTTIDNITFGPLIRGEDKSTIKKDAETLLEKVGLIEFKDKYPIQLSGGMQRRAELARAMINKPEVMIMDEPFRGLDAMSRELMQDFFVKLFEENRKTNIFVTSEIDEAIFLADRLVVLTNKPTKVRKIINIDLPRPRSFDMLRSEEAYDYKREAMELLHEEAMKSFTSKDDVGKEFMKTYSIN